MAGKIVLRNIVTGMLAGLAATWITDQAERLLWQATPDSEREREPDRRDNSSAGSAARKLIETTGSETTEEKLRITKNVIHYGLGATWGTLYPALRHSNRMTPVTAGIASGVSLSLVFDEILNPLLDITPPNRSFPASSHMRGFATHIIWGLATAASAESLQQLIEDQSGNRVP